MSPNIDEDFTDKQLEELLPTNPDEPVFIGNSRTKVFHKKGCYCVKQIRSDHQVGLDLDLKDEKGRVYRACCKCFDDPEVVENIENQSQLEDY
jgi:argonaute-like protein implicated in RNA metabolism and viral defense